MVEHILTFAPLVGVVAAVVGLLWAAHWLLIGRQAELGNERKFSRQLIMLGLTILGLLACVLALPISDSSRNQLIGLVGIVISGMLAFSSTTIISNLMAGILLRITKPFRVGDFIRIGDHFGRVTERGLFDTEIQTETRELIALPNTYCINNPVAATLSSGTIISATLSLGYDLDHARIERLLEEAATTCGLREPFVHIMELGNFSVTYRVSGFLDEPKRLISVRSSLYGCVLDTLHGQGIEILSPAYMNQRQVGLETPAIPSEIDMTAPKEPDASPEDIAFDKADKAEKKENRKQELRQEMERLETLLKEDVEEERKKALKEALEQAKQQLKELAEKADPAQD
jgi:small-conductance mechanosensitive channel